MGSSIYTHLDPSSGQFRIMKLLPGSNDQQLACDLFIDVLPKDGSSIAKPEYDALSYEWSVPDAPEHEILISGQPFSIRHNLFQALQRLRLDNEERKLWIDALCIDQTNVREESSS
jgi:hypothetical protein